ncbi:MAG: LTA synthase family protein [Bacteroidaceae bacterium]|nr:LTA synthase family protein [Bacteroidaceae bacterium]
MKRSIHYLEYLYCHLLIVFLIGRVGFILNNRCVEQLSFLDACGACWRGFVGHDLMVAAWLLVVPWLVGLLALRRPAFGLRFWLTPYYIIMGFCVSIIIVADAVMYEFWQFKLGMVALSYASSPEGTTNSVPLSYILVRAAVLLLLTLWTVVPCILLTPKTLPTGRSERLWMRNISIIWVFLLISGVCFMRQGDVYGNPKALVANHAAVNPVYAFASSIRLSKDYSRRYDYLSEEDRSDLFRGLYPEPADDIQDTLLTSQRPNILVVFLEGFGSRFVKELGGLPDVAPGWSRLIPEGIFWENYYSNSFRTDRGTVSAFSGWLSYTDVGLMKQTKFHSALPSLARSLEKEGYETGYVYGGTMSNMGKRQYLEDMDYQHLYDISAFTSGAGSWGINDSTALQKACELIGQWEDGHHFLVVQTLSSHEPWDVPYHRLEDEKLNAFAYSDYSVACMVDSLRQLPEWDNLLVVIIPDHGFLYQQSYDDPGFFHAPMLWLGGAIREPRRMDILMNQSDIPATLLSQMGIPHNEYPWSRNVLSQTYTYPFVYCNWPAGLLFIDSTGTSIYDTDGDVTIVEQPADNGQRVLRAKAILQTSYDQLGEMSFPSRHTPLSGSPCTYGHKYTFLCPEVHVLMPISPRTFLCHGK